jgi:hypothetical protein
LLDQHPDISHRIHAGSLLKFLRRTEGDFSRQRAVLLADEDARTKCVERYGKECFRVGISWRTSNDYTSHLRSLTLEELRGLLSIPYCQYVNLQYGDVAVEVKEFNAAYQTSIYCDMEVDHYGDFDAVVAQIASMHAVVTIDNTVAHIAGALGVHTLLLLPRPSYWQWPAEGSGSRWYPSVTLLRQDSPGDWSSPLRQAQEELMRYHTQFQFGLI